MTAEMTRASAAQWQALNAYLARLQTIMRLSDWSIKLLPAPVDEEQNAAASIFVTEGRRIASIKMAIDWHEQSAEKLRHNLTHELIHVYVEGMDTVASKIQTAIGDVAFRSWHDLLVWQLECATDGLADVLAPFLPLPEIPSEPETIGIEVTTGAAS